ncbi:hypothetical protein NLU13_7598 [Sarocladium strictum]|uniref:chitinase n=1 Tax=Sarocladium strictum TaxID=5046 RepID=A0AA39GD32_SARSR|nr:hypothetical protein NLU13_7598 [Sarocladium strictum]
MLSFKSLLSVILLLQTAAAAGYVNAGYYASWKTYAGYTPEKLNYAAMSHVFYAFASISANGTVYPTDPWGDYQQPHAGDQLYLQKKKNRKLKVLLSIGGATANGGFLNATTNSASRSRFVNSAIKLMLDFGMDGIDLDWEFPTTTTQANNYYLTIKQMRDAIDKKAAALGQNYHYLVTAALPAGPANYNLLNLASMSYGLDFFNIMAYDFSGPWSTVGAHASNLYNDKSNPSSTPVSADKAVRDYIAKGVPASKINLGIPLYGKSFANSGGLGKSYKGTRSPNADFSIPFNQLPKSGAKVMERPDAGALVTWDSNTKELVTLDGGYSARLKAAYLKQLGLAGAFFWETSGDKTGSSSLITIVKNALGTLDQTNNQLMYPSSEFVNIRNGVPTSRK